MGEEFGAETPFLFFCDFEKDLAAAVTSGRRNEFALFDGFRDPRKREQIPDPKAAATFEMSRLDWDTLAQSSHQEWLRFYRHLLQLRSEHIVPHLSAACRTKSAYQRLGDGGLTACWELSGNSQLTLLANLGHTLLSDVTSSAARIIYASDEVDIDALRQGILPSWSVVWCLE
jgi:1,4-alpha-glucan branching enzyme